MKETIVLFIITFLKVSHLFHLAHYVIFSSFFRIIFWYCMKLSFALFMKYNFFSWKYIILHKKLTSFSFVLFPYFKIIFYSKSIFLIDILFIDRIVEKQKNRWNKKLSLMSNIYKICDSAAELNSNRSLNLKRKI